MDIEKTWAELQTLPSLILKINKRDKSSIQILNKLNLSLFGESVIAGCSNCHIKAFRKLTSLTYQNLIDMNNKKFKLKKGITIEFPVRGGKFYNSETLTDDLARIILVNHPEMKQHFASVPVEQEPGSLKEEVKANVSDEKPLDKMNKKELQAEYVAAIGEAPSPDLTKAELIKEING